MNNRRKAEKKIIQGLLDRSVTEIVHFSIIISYFLICRFILTFCAWDSLFYNILQGTPALLHK